MTKIFSSGAAELFPWLYFVRWKATAFFIGKSSRSYLIERWNRCVTSSTWSSNFSHLTLDTYAFFNGVEESTSFLRLLFLRTLPQILVSNNPASLTQFPFFSTTKEKSSICRPYYNVWNWSSQKRMFTFSSLFSSRVSWSYEKCCCFPSREFEISSRIRLHNSYILMYESGIQDVDGGGGSGRRKIVMKVSNPLSDFEISH